MALTQEFLKELGLTEEQIEGVLGAWDAEVEAWRAQVEDAETWRAQAEEARRALEDYRVEVEGQRRDADVRAAYQRLLEREHVDPRRWELILRATSFDGMELGEDGELMNVEALAEVIRREWADFIVVRERRGAKVQTPPGNRRPTMSKSEILSIRDTAQRQRAIAENHDLFGF